MESLGVGTTSPYLNSLLRDQTQQGLFSREKEEARNKVRSPWASGELIHTSPPCCVTRLNKGFSLVRKKKQGTKFGVHGYWKNFPISHLLLRDQTQPGLFFCEKEEAGNEVWSPWASVKITHPSTPYCVTRLNKGLFSQKKEETGNKVWSPWVLGQLPHSSHPCCVTRLNQGYSLVRRKKQENSFESLGVGTNSPPLLSLLRDQTQPGLFSREMEEAGNKVWSPRAPGEITHPSPPYCVTRLNKGYSLVKRKKQGIKFGVPRRRENFPIPYLPAA